MYFQALLKVTQKASITLKNSLLSLYIDEGTTEYDVMAEFESDWNAGRLDRATGVEHSFSGLPDELWYEVQGVAGTTYERCEVSMTYKVKSDAWLGQFKPNESRGLIDYLDDWTFIPSFMNLSDLPVERDESWAKIDDPDQVALKVRGLVITKEATQFMPASRRAHGGVLTYVGPLSEDEPPPDLEPGTRVMVWGAPKEEIEAGWDS